RGDAKYAFDHRAALFAAGDGSGDVVPFSSSDAPESAADRTIGSIGSGDGELAALHRYLGIGGLPGTPLDDLVVDQGGQAHVHELEQLLDPGEEPLAIVEGQLDLGAEEPGADAIVLVAVDGIVVTGSPLFEFGELPHFFAALLPPEVVDHSKRLRLGVLTGDGVREVDVVVR
ncbi:MAG: hypothetical protein OES57_17295, partial [Acidimicrobiia bacterium]|nr:hypothetical protein [Acidimicrobiia bacterium]